VVGQLDQSRCHLRYMLLLPKLAVNESRVLIQRRAVTRLLS
jgi:hypothetical protein